MSEVFLHKKGLPDKRLGHVTEAGKVFRTVSGDEEEVGYVELETGKIYISLVDPGTYAGKVRLDSGKVFRHVAHAVDEYLGEVHKDGKMYIQKTAWPDKYVGNVSEFTTTAHAGAAFLLLVLPAVQE